METVMERSLRTQFAELARAKLTAKPGLTREELAGELGFRYDDQFDHNLLMASDMQMVHAQNGKYYAGERKRE